MKVKNQFRKKQLLAGCLLITCLILMLMWYLGPLKYMSAYVILHTRLKLINPSFAYSVSSLNYHDNPEFDYKGYTLYVTGEEVDDQFSVSWDNFNTISDTYQYDILNKEQTNQRLENNYRAEVLRMVANKMNSQDRMVLDFGGTAGMKWMQETFERNMDYSKSMFDELSQHFGFHAPASSDLNDLVARLQNIQEMLCEKKYPITIYSITLHDVSESYVFSNITPNDLNNQFAVRLNKLLQGGDDETIQLEIK